MRFNLKNVVFFFLMSNVVFSACDLPDFSDPDEWMDNIGRTSFCQTMDKEHSNVIQSREDLGVGYINSNGGNNAEGARTAVIGLGGYLYVVGRTNGGNNDFLVIKYFPDGLLDTSFDTDGKLTHSFSTTDDVAHAAALQSDGKLLVAGRTDNGSAGNFVFAILRLNSNGTLDSSFNTTGKSTVAATTGPNIARAIKIQTDGLILLSGYGKVINYDCAFSRLTSDGKLDTSFNTTGKISVGNGTTDDGCLTVSVDSNGNVIGAGNSYNGSDWDFAVVRLLSSGSLDSSFSTDGKATNAIGAGDDVGYGVVIGNTNIITLGGATYNGSNLDFGFIRYLTDGSLDTTFNTTGKISLAPSANDDVAYSIGLQTDGVTLLAAGYSYNGSNNDFRYTRIKSDGTLDTSFFTSGSNTLAFYSGEDVAQTLAMLGDGYILIAGRTDTNGSGAYDFALVRIQSDGTVAKSGDAVKSFGTNGKIFIDFSGTDSGVSIVADTSHRLVVYGNAGSNSNDFAIGRLLINGNLDTTFNTSGTRIKNPGGVDVLFSATLQTDGKIAACGGGGGNITVIRLLTDGGFDTSFNTTGEVALVAGAGVFINATPDQKLVIVGNTGNDFLYSRLNTDGSYDTSFNTFGYAIRQSQLVNFLIIGGGISPDQDIYGWGKNVTISGGLLQRVTTDGRYDTAFSLTSSVGFSHTQTTQGVKVTVSSSGQIYLAANTAKTRGLFRYHSNGIIDTSFATDGGANPAGGTALGSALAPSGNSFLIQNTGVVALLNRYLSSGALDTSYSTDGNITISASATDYPIQATFLMNGWLCTNGQIGSDFPIYCFWQ